MKRCMTRRFATIIDEQDLPIDADTQSVPPLVIIDASSAQERRCCIHCALRAALVTARTFHNGNVLVHHGNA
jgi:hypothetical protein